MTDKPWKAMERYVCKMLHMTRKSVYGKGAECIGRPKTPWYSPECKWREKGQMFFSTIIGAIEQARENKEHPDDIPVAFVMTKGMQKNRIVVCMFMEDYLEHHVPPIVKE